MEAVKQIFLKIEKIVSGWANYARYHNNSLPEKTLELAATRLEFCNECKIRYGYICSPVRSMKHEKTGKIAYGCGCPVIPHALSIKEECPVGKWSSQI